MAVRNIILNLLVSMVLAHGVVGLRNLPPEKQLDVEDKVPVKTITTELGDVYDCIDFYEQPAFDHHLLNKHDYHSDMKPSFVPNEIADSEKDRMEEAFRLKRVDCPKGTVPIRRTRRQDLMTETNDDGEIFYAGAATDAGIGKIQGASAGLSVDNPSLGAFNQYSSSIISVEGGNEFLHAGWTVHPQLYGDYNTRLYIWTNADNASCYNVICTGFVIVNSHYPIDSILKEANDTSGIGREIKVVIYRDNKSGNWWLALAIKKHNMRIGFWSKHLFSTMLEGADKAYYGGVVAVPSVPIGAKYPEMGTGKYPLYKNNIRDVAYCRRISTIDEDGNEKYADSESELVKPYMPRYSARYLRYPYQPENFESTIIFGGH